MMYASIASPLLPIFFAVRRRKSLNDVLLLIVALVVISVATDVAMLMLGMKRINNLPVAHVYGLIEAGLLILFFARINAFSNTTRYLLLTAYSTFYIFNSVFNESIFVLNGFARSIEAFMVLFFCIYTMYRFYVKEEDVFIEKSPTFWIVIGILFYFSGALFSFLLAAEIFSRTPDNLFGSWVLHNISNILKNILIAVGIWKISR